MLFFFFKQKTAYEIRISDLSSDVCSSDLRHGIDGSFRAIRPDAIEQVHADIIAELHGIGAAEQEVGDHKELGDLQRPPRRPEEDAGEGPVEGGPQRSEEHTSELQSLMRISYAVFCLKKKKKKTTYKKP